MAEGRVFISYRRGLDSAEARSIYYQLERHFDRDQLFMDVDDIVPGTDFVDHLERQVSACGALIALIGPGWIGSVDRLHDEEDFVRIEIEAALKRGSQIPVIPLLIDDNKLPPKNKLPECLQNLVRRSGVPIRHESYTRTVSAVLVPALERALAAKVPELQDSREIPSIPGSDDLLGEKIHSPASSKSRLTTIPQMSDDAIVRMRNEVRKTWAERDANSHLPEPGTIFRDVEKSWCPEMVVIPPGTFLMGSPENEPGRFNNEGPQHEVEIAQPFALARYTTTFDEYDAFCDATDREKPGDEGWGRGRRPVINVSWHDAIAYCEWLSERTGHQYRLPSETEWEFACRAGTETAYSFGDAISTELANYDGKTNAGWFKKGEYREKTVPVDFPGFKPNTYGLSQMHGNVWEWCSDQFADSYESPRRQTPFQTGSNGGPRVLRGGSWNYGPQLLRSARRGGHVPGDRGWNSGFRPARTLQSSEPSGSWTGREHTERPAPVMTSESRFGLDHHSMVAGAEPSEWGG